MTRNNEKAENFTATKEVQLSLHEEEMLLQLRDSKVTSNQLVDLARLLSLFPAHELADTLMYLVLRCKRDKAFKDHVEPIEAMHNFFLELKVEEDWIFPDICN